MKGLLLKDFYMMLKYCRAYLLIALVFAAVSATGAGNVFFMIYPVLLASMIPVTLISYDERSGWNSYADTLPYTRSMLVSAKYALALLVLAACLVICGGAQLGRMLYLHAFDPAALLQIAGMLLGLGLFAPSVMLPVIFKFGAEKGRIVYYVVIGLTCAVFAFIGAFASEAGLPGKLPVSAGIWAVAGTAALLFSFSWLLSIRFYQNREL